MSTTAATASTQTQEADGNLVLIVSQTGTICGVVEAPESIREQLAADEATIESLWPADLASQIRSSLKRTLRNRRSHHDDIENIAEGRSHEIVYVAQGPDRVMMIVRDLSEQKLALSKVRKLAYTDEATGLPNREFLFNELQKITDVHRLKEGRAAMICIHVGEFDNYGYTLNASEQDDVLKQLAARLTSHLRGSNDEFVRDYERYSVAARTDFRQFSVVLPSIESGEDAEAVVERLVKDLAQPVTVGNRSLRIRPSGGVALFPQDGIDSASLFTNAAAAMEDARNDSSVPYKFHSGTVRLRTLQRQDLEVELRSALERKEYALNFLPIIDAKTDIPVTVEALLRWPDTILGTQPTRKIVRVAERTGLILPIGEWVLRHACEQLQAWRLAGYDQVRVAINLSAQELASDDIVDRVERILVETNTEPTDLDIELKEHMLFREVLKDYATCKKLKALGARIVIDDYGVGACSLAHLSQSPVDAIKIDNSFVANIVSSHRDKAACSAATAMANELGIEVIAEGVETEAQAEILRSQGCHFLQGFLFSTPMTDDETLQYLGASASQQKALGRN